MHIILFVLFLNIDPCRPNPCLHGGECQPDPETGSFTCNCTGSGYIGPTCRDTGNVEKCSLVWCSVKFQIVRIHEDWFANLALIISIPNIYTINTYLQGPRETMILYVL